MRKLLTCLTIIAASTIMVFSESVETKKSWRAYKTDGLFDKAQLDSLAIQVELGKYTVFETDKNPVPVPTAEQKKNGYILFFRNYLFDVFPYTIPTEKEIAKKDLKIFASQGEYEPIVFSVYPLENLTDCRVVVSDFQNEKGDKLTRDCFEVNNVMSWPVEDGRETSMIQPMNVLRKMKDIPLIEKEISKSVWITVKIPDSANGGVYKGNVTFAPSGKPASLIPVEIRVLPFKLLQPGPDVMTWAPIMAGSWDFEQLEKEFVIIKEHGMTGEVTGSLVPEGKGDFTKANKYMEMARKTGLPGKFVSFGMHIQGTSKYETTYGPWALMGDELFSESTYQRMGEVIRSTEENARKNNWLPFVQYLTTECGYPAVSGAEANRKTMKGVEEYYAAARKASPTARLMATFNRQEELALHWNNPNLDEFGFNGEMFPEWEKGAMVKPSWMTFIAIDNRCGHGFYMWKFNLKAVRPWCLHMNMLDSRAGLTYWDKVKKEFSPVARFERIREGVDDYKYLYTLSELIKEAKAKGKDTKAAEAAITTIIDKIPHDHKKYTPGFDYLKMDEFRLQLAEQILKLK